MTPEARQDKLLVQEVGDELVIYDQERCRAHQLNRTAAFVWHHCDGQTNVANMPALLQNELNFPEASEELVWLALDRLDKAHLLREKVTSHADVSRISRRELIRKMKLAGLIFLLPVVTSIIAPTPAMAASVMCW